ncbi:MAG: septal ring lytic transglycosylase RlpA family protein [Calditrichaeota bacterium]|nr:MAG: septal ring lytic transglycosylase RlpA family protein [Calditrichota bacterium]
MVVSICSAAVSLSHEDFARSFRFKFTRTGIKIHMPDVPAQKSQMPFSRIQIAGLVPSPDEPAEWIKKFLDRIQKAREEAARQARESLRKRETRFNRAVNSRTPGRVRLSAKMRAQPVPAQSRRRARPAKPQRTRPFQQGLASFYGKRWNGRRTASGEIFNSEKFTAAHRTLPFGTFVRVVRKDNGRSVVVRINDRGPFKRGRIIDLSTAGARRLGMIREGLANVELYPATLVDFLKQFQK